MVLDFFKSLVRGRVTGIEGGIQAKKFAAIAKAKGKVAGTFTKALDKPMEAAQKKAKAAAEAVKSGKSKDKQQDKPKDQPKGEKMGLFGKKKQGGAAAPPQQAIPESQGDASFQHTRAINLNELVDDRSQDCVGWVVALVGDQKGRDFRLVPGKNVVGTSANCDIVLTDQYMSSRHCTVNYENGTFTLVDLDSTNGSYVNDKRISKIELIDNDKVRLGRTELKFKSLF